MEGNCTVRRILFYIEGCIDDEEIAGVMLGVFSAALWTLVHISFYTYQRRNMKMNQYITSTITIHMVADGFSCVGAILAQQKSLQVLFALFGTVVNSAIGLHGWCSKSCDNTTGNTGDLSGSHKRVVGDRYHCLCSTVFLTLSLMFITMCVTEYLTISDDNVVYQTSKQPHRHTILVVGYILGCVGTLCYWLSKFYEVVESYRNSRNRGVHMCMYLTAITGDTTYLLGVYIQMSTLVYVIQTLPWTLARMGLIGIHIGIILQRRCSMAEEKDTDKVTLLKNRVEKSDSDWSDDSSTVICGTCDLQTSVKQIICSDVPVIQLDSHMNTKEQRAHYSDKQIPESPSVENPELETVNRDNRVDGQPYATVKTQVEVDNRQDKSLSLESFRWDFEWLSDTKRKQFSDVDIHKLSPYSNGYYKVVEWFKRSCDTECDHSDVEVDDVIENNNSKDIVHTNSHNKILK